MQVCAFSKEGRPCLQLYILPVGKQSLGAAWPLLQKLPDKICTKQEKGCCLYLTCSSFKAFKMFLTNKKSTYYITCLILFCSSKKAEINPVVNANRTFCLLGDILLAPFWLLAVLSVFKQKKTKNQQPKS